MSGRDVEPLAAFFPSIDRGLMRDLDRHLRTAQPPSPAKSERQTSRPNVDGAVEAITLAASSMSDMASRIQALEGQLFGLEAVNSQLRKQLAEAGQAREAAETAARAAADTAKRAEAGAATHIARAEALERELAQAVEDLTRVTDAISAALGVPDERGR